jgi:hypothetical protein
VFSPVHDRAGRSISLPKTRPVDRVAGVRTRVGHRGVTLPLSGGNRWPRSLASRLLCLLATVPEGAVGIVKSGEYAVGGSCMSFGSAARRHPKARICVVDGSHDATRRANGARAGAGGAQPGGRPKNGRTSRRPQEDLVVVASRRIHGRAPRIERAISVTIRLGRVAPTFIVVEE